MPIAIEIRSNRIPQLTAQLRRRVGEEVAAAAVECQSNAKVLVPKDTGTLARSLHAEKESALAWVVGTNLEYAARIEFGFMDADALGRVYHQSAQPYLTPAAETARQRFIDALNRVIGEIG